jgi:hypothetical protein
MVLALPVVRATELHHTESLEAPSGRASRQH